MKVAKPSKVPKLQTFVLAYVVQVISIGKKQVIKAVQNNKRYVNYHVSTKIWLDIAKANV